MFPKVLQLTKRKEKCLACQVPEAGIRYSPMVDTIRHQVRCLHSCFSYRRACYANLYFNIIRELKMEINMIACNYNICTNITK